MRKFIIFISLLLFGCGQSLCENTLKYEIASPNKNNFLTVFERNCGATTPLINVVSLRNKDQTLDMKISKVWVFTAHGESEIRATWIDDKNILVSYSTFDAKPTMKSSINEISITYQKIQ